MVYNYSQINYLQQTVLLYNEAANNQGFSAEHYNTILPIQSVFFSVVFIIVSFFLVCGLFLSPSLPRF